ncbi:MAG: 2-amino-4-hydroxy-6-hydroxymethyldihydropteridine diphosphokinase [Burkholderiaceae bacterium]
MVTAYVGLGANLGDAASSVSQAVDLLSQLPHTRLCACSSLYRSAPIDATGDDFVNAAVQLDTRLDAHTLLTELQHIESRFGRERPFRNAPRTLDLDLLVFGTDTICDSTLEVPHPRMANRAFVLLPLHELNPQLQIPGLGPVAPLLAQVGGQLIEKLVSAR